MYVRYSITEKLVDRLIQKLEMGLVYLSGGNISLFLFLTSFEHKLLTGYRILCRKCTGAETCFKVRLYPTSLDRSPVNLVTAYPMHI